MSTRIWLAKIGFIQTRQNRICLLRQIRRRACLLLRAWRKVFTPMEYGTEWCLFCMTGGEEAALDRARCAIADTAARDGFGRRTRPVAANRLCVRRRGAAFPFPTNAMRPLPRARAAERGRLSAISIPNVTAALRAARRTENRRCGRFCAFARRSHRRQLRRTGDAGEFIQSCRLPTAFAPVCEICRKLSGAFCRAQAIRRLLREAHYILGAVFRTSTISGVG